MVRLRKVALAGVSLLTFTTPAFAQDASDDAADDKEIVVTGTLIRGIAPGGSQSIAVGQEKIEAIGAAFLRKPKGHDFVIARRTKKPAVGRHMSVTGG